MERKQLVWMFMAVGSFLGSIIPTVWGAGMFSMSSVFFTAVGGIAGIYIAYRLSA